MEKNNFFVLLRDEIFVDEVGRVTVRPCFYGRTFPTRAEAEEYVYDHPITLMPTGDVRVHPDMLKQLHWHVKEYQL